MAEKTTKIDDIKRPDKVTPSATARPIVVTNHPTMASDPMMAPGEEKKDEMPAEQTMSHTAKAIKPIDASLTEDADAEDADESADLEAAPTEAKTADNPDSPKPGTDTEAESKASPKTEGSVASKPAASPEPSGSTAAEAAPINIKRDGEAELSAEEIAAAEAKAKREEELETLVISGKYAVPIDAVQRKRSQINTLLLVVLALVLAVALADATADAGLVKPPASVPHTHFFSAK